MATTTTTTPQNIISSIVLHQTVLLSLGDQMSVRQSQHRTTSGLTGLLFGEFNNGLSTTSIHDVEYGSIPLPQLYKSMNKNYYTTEESAKVLSTMGDHSYVQQVHQLDSRIYRQIYNHKPYGWYITLDEFNNDITSSQTVSQQIYSMYTLLFPYLSHTIDIEQFSKRLFKSTTAQTTTSSTLPPLSCDPKIIHQENNDYCSLSIDVRIQLFLLLSIYLLSKSITPLETPPQRAQNPDFTALCALNNEYTKLIRSQQSTNINDTTSTTNIPSFTLIYIPSLLSLFPESIFASSYLQSSLSATIGLVPIVQFDTLFNSFLPTFFSTISSQTTQSTLLQLMNTNPTINTMIKSILGCIPSLIQQTDQSEEIVAGFEIANNTNSNQKTKISSQQQSTMKFKHSLITLGDKLKVLKNILQIEQNKPNTIPYPLLIQVKHIILSFMINPLSNLNYNNTIEQKLTNNQQQQDDEDDINEQCEQDVMFDELLLQLSLQIGNNALRQAL